MPEFQGFSQDSFEFLRELKQNNNKDWMDDNTSRYRDLRKRVKALIEDIAAKYISLEYPTLETKADSRHCLSRIARRWPTTEGEVYYPYLWAAFYRKATGGKSKDFQLYITIHDRFFEAGIYFGDHTTRSFRDQFRDKVRSEKTTFLTLARQLPNEFKFPFTRNLATHDTLPENQRVEDERSLDSWLQSDNLEISRVYDFDDLTLRSAQLVDSVIEDFRKLDPIYRFIWTTYEELPSEEQRQRISLSSDVEEFIRKFKSDPEMQRWLERKNRAFEKWRPRFSRENIDSLSSEEFRSFLGYKENQSWDGIHRHSTVYADMGALRNTLKYLVDRLNDASDEEIQRRLDEILSREGAYKIRGLGRAVVTAIMHIVDERNRLGVWNQKVDDAFKKLGLAVTTPSRSFGAWYLAYNSLLNQLGEKYGLSLRQMDMLVHMMFPHPCMHWPEDSFQLLLKI